jgi:hypothetical protein
MAQLTRTGLVAAVLSAAGAAALAPAAAAAPLAALAPGRRRLDSTPLYADPSSTARNVVRAPNPQVVPLSVRGAATQSVALQTWESSGGDPVALVAGDGGIYTDSSVHIRGSTRNGQSARQPLMILSSDGTQKWSLGLDSSDRPANDSFFLGRVNGDTVIDVLFVKSYSPTQHAVGINLIPPPRAGLAVSGWDNSADAPSLLLRVGVRQFGEAIRVVDSGGVTRAAIRSDGSIVTPRLRVTTPFPPRERTSPGERGDIAWDSGYVYVCIAKNRWRRAQLADW